MPHFDLSTGKRFLDRAAQIDSHFSDCCQLMLRSGCHHVPDRPGYEFLSQLGADGVVGLLSHQKRPCLIVGLAPSDGYPKVVWQSLCRRYSKIRELMGLETRKPKRMPADASWIASGVLLAEESELKWMLPMVDQLHYALEPPSGNQVQCR